MPLLMMETYLLFHRKKLIQETLAFVFSDSNFDGYYKLRFSAQFFKMLLARHQNKRKQQVKCMQTLKGKFGQKAKALRSVSLSLLSFITAWRNLQICTEQKKVKAFELCSSDASRDVIAVITLPSIVCNLVSCTNQSR